MHMCHYVMKSHLLLLLGGIVFVVGAVLFVVIVVVVVFVIAALHIVRSSTLNFVAWLQRLDAAFRKEQSRICSLSFDLGNVVG